MPPLKNARWERFAQNMAAGQSTIVAYGNAGFRNDSKRPYRLLEQKPDIQARVTELLTAAASEVVVSREQVIEELKLIAFADMGDYAEWDKSGVRLKASVDLGDARRAVVEVRESRGDQGQLKAVSIKLGRKMEALPEIAKLLGLYERHNEQKRDARAVVIMYPENGR